MMQFLHETLAGMSIPRSLVKHQRYIGSAVHPA